MWDSPASGVWEPFGVGVWLLVALVGIVRAVANAWGLMAWVSWAGLALGLAEAVRWAGQLGDPGWAFAGGAMAVAGLAVAVSGGVVTLARVAMAHRGDVLGTQLTNQWERQRDHTAQRELVHGARNAMMAIEGAFETLDRFGDRLSDAQRTELQGIVRRGIENLRTVLAPPPDGAGAGPGQSGSADAGGPG